MKHNNNESKKSPITSTQITNEFTQHISNTKQANETTFSSGVLKENSSLDKSSSKITNNNNVGNKIFPSFEQEIVSIQNVEVTNKSPTLLTNITNESTQTNSSTKQDPVNKYSSEELHKNSSLDKSSLITTNNIKVGKKMLYSPDKKNDINSKCCSCQ